MMGEGSVRKRGAAALEISEAQWRTKSWAYIKLSLI